jgi:hypothetical protein
MIESIKDHRALLAQSFFISGMIGMIVALLAVHVVKGKHIR